MLYSVHLVYGKITYVYRTYVRFDKNSVRTMPVRAMIIQVADLRIKRSTTDKDNLTRVNKAVPSG